MSPKNTKNHRILSNFTKAEPSTTHRRLRLVSATHWRFISPKSSKASNFIEFYKAESSTTHHSDALYQLRIGGSFLQNHQKHRILSNFTKQSLRRLTALMLCIRARLLVGPLEANQDLGFSPCAFFSAN
jgi:hypothetical protein